MTVFFHAHIDELEYMLRIAIAALCGGIIGFERSRMRKEAGLRTHIIVAVAGAACSAPAPVWTPPAC